MNSVFLFIILSWVLFLMLTNNFLSLLISFMYGEFREKIPLIIGGVIFVFCVCYYIYILIGNV
ncbi:hypothetical protein SAMN04487787_1289 [Kosakonia sacchari]|nr:hypothetical protein SAMN04487787_1289 [Kosakonia sacchari]